VLRVTTLYAGTAAATARYYTKYLTQAPGEVPGVWTGGQAAGLGLAGEVSTDALESLLSGCDPTSGTTLGHGLKDRTKANGVVIRAVAGFDATLSAPKSLSVWWALTGDPGLAECHDIAVNAVVETLERFGSTTRIRSNGGRLHPDSQGLTVAAFRQTTSRLDDPQLHTHLVISSKVQTEDGRWLALDARVLKQHQRAFGGLYQSVLRAELTDRYGVGFAEIVNGQAEIAGVPTEVLARFSKRAAQVKVELQSRIDEFRDREGRFPTRFEHAAMEREAAADTRLRKPADGVTDLRTRWRTEAAEIGVTAESLGRSIDAAARTTVAPVKVSVGEIIEGLSVERSAWHRMDIVRAVTDRLRPQAGINGQRWSRQLDRAVDRVLDHCITLDPDQDDDGGGARRVSDGRSVWIEPVAAQVTSREILAQEEAILAWLTDAQQAGPSPSMTVNRTGLDVVQADAAAAAAGEDRVVVIVGPAGTGKTTTLAAAVTDLHRHHRRVFGVAPTAKAAKVLGQETGMDADTVAKLLHEWARADGPGPHWRLPAGSTLVVDEAGMLSTPNLHRLTQLASEQRWRLVLVGDHRQLQAVGRGGMFTEICTTARMIELESIYRFTHDWEATASRRLRHSDPRALDTYQAHGRIIPGTLEEHLHAIATQWLQRHAAGETVAITAATNEHVDAINHTIRQLRARTGSTDTTSIGFIADGVVAIGDIVATRRNHRHLRTTSGDIVRNRERWTVTAINNDSGDLTVTDLAGTSTVTLPAGYVEEHVRLGYAATEYGTQSATETASITLATNATTGRGLYVAMTRGRNDNRVHVVTDTHDITEARDILETIIATDRSDVPAVVHRRRLTEQHRQPPRPQPPQLQPRCQVPDWFHQLRADATDGYRQAREALDDSLSKRSRLVQIVDTAARRIADANTMCTPFDAELDVAQDAVKHAEAAQRAAQQRLDRSGLRGRRQARTELVAANETVTSTRERLADARDRAREPYAQRNIARTQIETARDALRNHDILTKWQYPPERLATANAHLDALDTWHDWATGKPVQQQRFVQTATTLHQIAAHDPDSGTRQLADVIHHWAKRNGIDLDITPPRIEQHRSRGIEIDL
jgi:conjugative relaxase-like TrwC/TraI family protein